MKYLKHFEIPEDLKKLTETMDVECKLAQGMDGKGELPRDFWTTYCAMANSHGGFIVLGVRERKPGVFSIAGIENVQKIKTELFDLANNRNKVSINLLTDQEVFPVVREGETILIVRIPQASRKQKPVFLNGNPLGNTYKRLHDGDRVCSDDDVKRMLMEQMDDARDRKIIEHYGMADLNPDSIRIYRQMFKDEKPKHPFLDLDDVEFLKKIGGWRQERETGQEGVTLAGLLMFGDWTAIREAIPHYFLDYQEKPEEDESDIRWLDRLIPDGSWSGNLFDFYLRVYRKLIVDIKVPFSIRGGQRRDDTLVHQALREALVNTFVHADYMGRASILVIKKPKMFSFRNPGHSRLPLEQVREGGESDCRNPLLLQMFLMIGLGEKAGSGIPKIVKGWTSQHWCKPYIYEKDEPEQTVLELAMFQNLSSEHLESSSEHLESSSEHLESSSEHLESSSTQILFTFTHLDAPFIDSLEKLDPNLKKQLTDIAKKAPPGKKLGRLWTEAVILELCEKYYLTLNILAELLQRHPNGLRQRYLNRMIKENKIVLAFPNTPTHEKQAYRTNNAEKKHV